MSSPVPLSCSCPVEDCGFPSRALLLAEVVTSWGEHHLVLVVRTKEGDFVADSLHPRVRPWA